MTNKPFDITEGELLAQEATPWKHKHIDDCDVGVWPIVAQGEELVVADDGRFDACEFDFIAYHDPKYMEELYGLVREMAYEVKLLSKHRCLGPYTSCIGPAPNMCSSCRSRALLGRVKLE